VFCLRTVGPSSKPTPRHQMKSSNWTWARSSSTCRSGANSGNPDLYVVVQGFIVFEGDMQADKLKTRTYATKIGYFQLSGGKLKHVYGAHYGMDEERPGHPVFMGRSARR